MAKRILYLLPALASAVLTASACGLPGGSGTSVSGSSSAPEYTGPPKHESEFDPACSGKRAVGARPYIEHDAKEHVIVPRLLYLRDDSATDDPYATPDDAEPGQDVDPLDPISEDVLPISWTPNHYVLSFPKVDLVLCVAKVSETFVKKCTYTSAGAAGELTVKHYSAKYRAAIHEAATGKQLAGKTLVSGAGPCPPSEKFKEGETARSVYESPNYTKIRAFVKPFMKS